MTLKEHESIFAVLMVILYTFKAAKEEYFQVVKYLIEQYEADPNIGDGRWNALH